MTTIRRSTFARLSHSAERPILFSLLLILGGTVGATSVTSPDNRVSYAGFALLLVLASVRGVRRQANLLRLPRPLLAYDLMPVALIAVWLYGIVRGFAAQNPPLHVLHNFFGMTLYAVYYVLLGRGVRRSDLVRCVVLAAGVTAVIMFGFFLFDKAWGRVAAHPTYFRFFAVRDYYSETQMLLLAPAALLVHQLLSPPARRPWRTGTLSSALLLYAYLFAFLQISLSKATLLAYLLGAAVTVLAMNRSILRLATHGGLLRLAAAAGTIALSLYPLAHLLAYVAEPVPPAAVSEMAAATEAPTAATSPTAPAGFAADAGAAAKPQTRAAPAALLDFIAAVQSTVAADGRIWIGADNAALFAGSVVGLLYPGASNGHAGDIVAIEQGSRSDIKAAVDRLGIRYLIVQTAQPPLHLFAACRFDRPLVRSDVITVTAQSRYAFELYAVDGCRRPSLIGRLPDAVVESKRLRREQAAAIIADLHLLGRGLGAPVRGDRRDPGSYGFEHNYLNLLHKFGVFALVIFSVYAVTLARMVRLASGFRTRHRVLASTALVSGLIMGFGNPMLMSPVTVTLHAIVLYWLRPPQVRNGAAAC